MKIFLPLTSKNLVNFTLSPEELFRKNVIYLENMRNMAFLDKIDDDAKIILTNLIQYFEEIEEYKYCSDILKIFEMNKELFD